MRSSRLDAVGRLADPHRVRHLGALLVHGARRIVRAVGGPTWHFLLLGALLFVSHALWRTPRAASSARPSLVLSAADLDRGRREAALREALGPVAESSDAQARDAAIDEAVLLREALDRAFDIRDPVVRARLLTLGRYLGLAPGGSDDAIEREARALGLQRSDEVVRRHLVEMMRLAAAKAAPADLPTEAELRAYYEAHCSRFAQPEHIALSHVYLSRERRGERLDADAAELLAALRRNGTDPRAAPVLGDPFARGARLPLASAHAIEQTFGPGFAAGLADLPTATWAGPVRSAYGLHLVWIERRAAATTSPFAVVRSRVLHQYLDDRRDARLADRLRTWRARYDIRIDQ